MRAVSSSRSHLLAGASGSLTRCLRPCALLFISRDSLSYDICKSLIINAPWAGDDAQLCYLCFTVCLPSTIFEDVLTACLSRNFAHTFVSRCMCLALMVFPFRLAVLYQDYGWYLHIFMSCEAYYTYNQKLENNLALKEKHWERAITVEVIEKMYIKRLEYIKIPNSNVPQLNKAQRFGEPKTAGFTLTGTLVIPLKQEDCFSVISILSFIVELQDVASNVAD